MQFIAHKLQGAINNPSNLLCAEKEFFETRSEAFRSHEIAIMNLHDEFTQIIDTFSKILDVSL